MFTLKRRLLAVTVLAVLALAQVMPALAGAVSISYPDCPYYNANGQSYRLSTYTYSQTTVSQSCGFLGLYAYFYDPVLGGYYADDGFMGGNSTVYYDSFGIVTPVYATHYYGTQYLGMHYNTNTSYG